MGVIKRNATGALKKTVDLSTVPSSALQTLTGNGSAKNYASDAAIANSARYPQPVVNYATQEAINASTQYPEPFDTTKNYASDAALAASRQYSAPFKDEEDEYSPTSSGSSEAEAGRSAPVFSMSSRTRDYYDALDDLEDDRPGAFSSRYQSEIDSLLQEIQNPEAFSLDDNDTYRQLYDNYRESYMAQGNRAMRDAMGSAAALTGGYGSSYATTAASQAYDNYLQQLNDRNIDLYSMALNDYWKNRNDKYNQLGAVQGQDAVDYGRYRDEVSDWQTDRAYYAGQAQASYGNDWAAYESGLSQYNAELDRAFQEEQAKQAQENWQAEMDYQNAVNYLKGLDTRGVMSAWANGDTATAEQLRAAALALVGGSGGSGGGGGGGRSRKTKSNDMPSSLTQDEFNADYIKILKENGREEAENYANAVRNLGITIVQPEYTTSADLKRAEYSAGVGTNGTYKPVETVKASDLKEPLSKGLKERIEEIQRKAGTRK